MNTKRKGYIERICIVSTGGTFEKSYDVLSENMVISSDSVVPDILNYSNVKYPEVRCLIGKDSLDVNDNDRRELLTHLEKWGFDRYVIVHGTSRIVETAKYLARESKGRVIVVTGAMKPYRYCGIEASFNLGCAIGYCNALNEGVWVAMNGHLFNPDNCVKNRNGVFKELDENE